MSVFDKGLITICVVCALFCLLALPLVLRKIPRNRIYGYRTCATLNDDVLWYDANAYFGRWFIITSILAVVTAAALSMQGGVSPKTYLDLSIVLLVAPVAVSAVLTQFFVRSRLVDGR